MRDSKEKIKGEDKMAVKTVDPEVAAKDRNGDGHISKQEMEMDIKYDGKHFNCES